MTFKRFEEYVKCILGVTFLFHVFGMAVVSLLGVSQAYLFWDHWLTCPLGAIAGWYLAYRQPPVTEPLPPVMVNCPKCGSRVPEDKLINN